MALDDILLEAEEKMIKTEEVVQHEFTGIRTGKASPVLVENILVEVYGSNMRIRELAGITTPESRVLVIQPWDQTTVHPIEKAIQKSSLGVNPTVQGKNHSDRAAGFEPGTAAGDGEDRAQAGGGRADCGAACAAGHDRGDQEGRQRAGRGRGPGGKRPRKRRRN